MTEVTFVIFILLTTFFALSPLTLNISSFPRSFDLDNFPYLDLTPVATNQGVWCFQSFYKVVVIWNPSLRKSVGLTVPSPLRGHQGRKYFIGFGVSPENMDPTVLHISLQQHVTAAGLYMFIQCPQNIGYSYNRKICPVHLYALKGPRNQ